MTTHSEYISKIMARVKDLTEADSDIQGPPLQLALTQIVNELERQAQTEVSEAAKLREQAKNSEIKAEGLRATKSVVYNVLNGLANQAEMAAAEGEDDEEKSVAKKKTAKKKVTRKKKATKKKS